ncbi:hypothetical protein HEP85_01765 [Streptomyces sp. RPA4-2]|uniref:hypothetical protein n=1 Tax=Streptomyces sp. RPA4-2 TaxID=2721244 RepID=UPI00143E4F6E|nr:hypothetical protein [Streptomyces sp. RPA4-2]QIY60653.1 hypothetical protein HEP85_01765 [Streptomyces sp. RPA4-2]
MPEMSESGPRRGVGHFVGARLLPLLLCVVTVVGAACFAVVGVSSEERRDREWRAATPCAAAAPVDVRADCVTTLPGVIERTKAKLNRSHRDSWLYFSGGRPVDRLNVSYDTAAAFEAGDHVTLTWWRGELMKVASERHTANEGVPRPGGIAGGVVFCVLAAGALAVFTLVRRRRDGRPVAADEPTSPSVFNFLMPLAVAAVWAVPLAGARPGRVVAIPVAAAGLLVVLVLLARAWRVSGRTPPLEPRALPEGEDVIVQARFLQDTPPDPGLQGSHIAVGAGPMAVLSHGGPGRLAGKAIPVGRFDVRGLRRPKRFTEQNVPAHWYVAELLDSGTPVRLAAAPADLLLLVRELERAGLDVSR